MISFCSACFCVEKIKLEEQFCISAPPIHHCVGFPQPKIIVSQFVNGPLSSGTVMNSTMNTPITSANWAYAPNFMVIASYGKWRFSEFANDNFLSVNPALRSKRVNYHYVPESWSVRTSIFTDQGHFILSLNCFVVKSTNILESILHNIQYFEILENTACSVLSYNQKEVFV